MVEPKKQIQNGVERNAAEKNAGIAEDELRLLLDDMSRPFSYFRIEYNEKEQPVDCYFLAVNQAFERETGKRREQIVGQDIFSIVPETKPGWIENFDRVARTGVPEQFVQYSKATQKWYSVLVESSRPERVAVTLSDITQYTEEREALKRAAQQLKTQQDENYRLAHEEPITGLPNRVCLYESFAARTEGEGGHPPFSIAIITPDNLAEILASYGSVLSDRIMRAMAQRLRAVCSGAGELFSMTGTDLALLFSSSCEDRAAREALAGILRAMKAPVEVDGVRFRISTNCGVACYPTDGTDRDELIMKANLALYQAKKSGGSVVRFNAQIGQSVMRRTRIRNALLKALEHREFELYYQPQIEIATGRLIGAEALLRWHSPELGEVPPQEFIKIAEESRLIFPLGAWVLKTACEALKRLEAQFQVPLRMAVNVSGAQLVQGGFVERVVRLLQHLGVRPEQLELEVTESVVLNREWEAVEKMNRLRMLGVRVALDDFGTGYSTLSLLRNLRVTALKIDRTFVQDANALAMTELMVRLGHVLGAEVIAEGVETEEQLRRVQKIGCDISQGFLQSRPMPFQAFVRYVEALNAEKKRS